MIRTIVLLLILSLFPGAAHSQEDSSAPSQPQNGVNLFFGAGNGSSLLVNLSARFQRSWSEKHRLFVGYSRWIPGIGTDCDCIAPCPSSSCYPDAHELFGGVLSELWVERSIRPFVEVAGGVVWGEGGDGPAPSISGGGGIRFGLGGHVSWRLSGGLHQVFIDRFKNPIGNDNRFWIVGLGLEISGSE